MDKPQQYQLRENPSEVRTAMKYSGDNFEEMHRWCRKILKTDDGQVTLDRTINIHEGDWVLHDEGKGFFWLYGRGAGGDGFFFDWEPYEAPGARAAREAKEQELRRVDL